MASRTTIISAGFILAFLALLAAFAGQALAQSGNPHPTPIVIALTPDGQPTAAPSPTSGWLEPDRFEPNDSPETATPLGFGLETGLTLPGDDRDYFILYLKAGQMTRVSTYVYNGLDTRLKVFWNGALVAENEDRSPVDLGSTVTFTAVADGWYLILVEKAAVYDGVYDLELLLTQPTATPTPAPTMTPTPSPTPLIQPDQAEPNDTPETAAPITPGLRGVYTVGGGDVDYFTFVAKAGVRYACETVTDQVDTLLTVFLDGVLLGVNDDRAVGRVDSYFSWRQATEQTAVIKVEARGGSYGQYAFGCQIIAPPVAAGSPAATPTAAAVVTATTAVTVTTPITLSVNYLGRTPPPAQTAITHVRLLVYYDANNDRQPGPGEGIANVSVLAVNAQGQPIARVFTNSQGEAVFNLSSDAVSRVIVPFVPGWSARTRIGEVNEIVLGLPAVRLPIFFPVQKRVSE